MNVSYNELEKSLTKDLNSIYLFYGTERYLIDNAVNKIKKKFGELLPGINYILVDETNLDNIVSEVESPAFFSAVASSMRTDELCGTKKLIIVKNTGLFKKDGRKKTATPMQEKLTDCLKEELEDIIIVFVEEEADKNILFEQIEKVGIICKIDELKLETLVIKLKQICELYKVKADNITLKYLVEVCGTNLQTLINEIRKLIEYAGENGTITIDSVNKLAIKQIDSVIFELTDNLAIKKIDIAIDILNNLIYQKEPIQKILITLYNHFKKLYLCSVAISLNKDIVNTLNLKPNQIFLVNKYKKQVSYFKVNELKELLNQFVELDYNSKIGKIDVDIGLKSILCNYCS